MSWLRMVQSLKRIHPVQTLISLLCVIIFCVFTYLQYNGADKTVISTIRKEYLFPPSPEPYKLHNPEESDPSMGQSVAVLHLLGLQSNGFFVEHDAGDGETHSNTIFMERNLHWQGVLIESNPSSFERLLEKQRHSWSINACLGDLSQTLVPAADRETLQVIDTNQTTPHHESTEAPSLTIDCFPLHLILLALNQTVVDYLSVNLVEHNLDVIGNIPHDVINVRTMSIRFSQDDEKTRNSLNHYLDSNGYSVHEIINNINASVSCFIIKKTAEFPNSRVMSSSVASLTASEEVSSLESR